MMGTQISGFGSKTMTLAHRAITSASARMAIVVIAVAATTWTITALLTMVCLIAGTSTDVLASHLPRQFGQHNFQHPLHQPLGQLITRPLTRPPRQPLNQLLPPHHVQHNYQLLGLLLRRPHLHHPPQRHLLIMNVHVTKFTVLFASQQMVDGLVNVL
jgi:hypothetical protein